jgi:hypothetical protein
MQVLLLLSVGLSEHLPLLQQLLFVVLVKLGVSNVKVDQLSFHHGLLAAIKWIALLLQELLLSQNVVNTIVNVHHQGSVLNRLALRVGLVDLSLHVVEGSKVNQLMLIDGVLANDFDLLRLDNVNNFEGFGQRVRVDRVTTIW